MSRLPVPGGDNNAWGNILNDFLAQAHNGDGSLKTTAVTAAGAEVVSRKDQPNGYAGLDGSGLVPTAHLPQAPLGVSQQTATVYAACDALASVDDLDAFGAYTYDNGASGVGATITGGGNGQLVAGGTAVTAGQRVAVNASNVYGAVRESGIYVVTTSGGAGAAFILTRAADANTAAELGVFFAVRAANKTVYFSPIATPFTVGTTGLAVAIENLTNHAEGAATASGDFAHAEGISTAAGQYAHAESDSTASGDYSHAESFATASGYFSHAENSATASGQAAHAEGNSTASGDYSHAEAFATASGFMAHAEGSTTAYATGMHSDGGNLFYSQFSRVTRARESIDNFPVQLVDRQFSQGLLFPDFNRAALLTVRVVARRTDANGTVASWQAQCMIEGDNTAAYRIIGDPSFSPIAFDVGSVGWAVDDLQFDGSEPRQLLIGVTGTVGTRINWSATIELDEIA